VIRHEYVTPDGCRVIEFDDRPRVHQIRVESVNANAVAAGVAGVELELGDGQARPEKPTEPDADDYLPIG